jgi:hypothetical protein
MYATIHFNFLSLLLIFKYIKSNYDCCYATWVIETLKSNVFWDITPCIPLKVNRSIQRTLSLPPAFKFVSRSAYSLTLKMEKSFSSETSDDFQWTTEGSIPHNQNCEDLKSCWHVVTRAKQTVQFVLQNYWVSGHCQSSGILNTRIYNVSETGSVMFSSI